MTAPVDARLPGGGGYTITQDAVRLRVCACSQNLRNRRHRLGRARPILARGGRRTNARLRNGLVSGRDIPAVKSKKRVQRREIDSPDPRDCRQGRAFLPPSWNRVVHGHQGGLLSVTPGSLTPPGDDVVVYGPEPIIPGQLGGCMRWHATGIRPSAVNFNQLYAEERLTQSICVRQSPAVRGEENGKRDRSVQTFHPTPPWL